MRSINYLRMALLLAASFLIVAVGHAQDGSGGEPRRQNAQRPMTGQPDGMRNDVLRRLGLTPDQIKKIRALNAERKPLMETAQTRLRNANRALDEAIYADKVSDADVRVRLDEVNLAQAEVARLRFMNELEVRKILTPEQLVRFRELRQRFEQARQRFQNGRQFGNRGTGNAPRPDRSASEKDDMPEDD